MMLAQRAAELNLIKLTTALTVLLLATVAVAGPAKKVDRPKDEVDPFFENMRRRLGYFSDYPQTSPYSSIYEEYFASVIQNNDKSMRSVATDDWRRVRPTSELCIDFLKGVQVKGYVMGKPYELIILDACLDWLFNESDNIRRNEKKLDMDRLGSPVKNKVKMLASDGILRTIYESTRFKGAEVSQKLQNDIHDYLARLLKIYRDHPLNGCHSLWLEAYDDFIEQVYLGDCEDEQNCLFYNTEGADQDSYLRMVADSTVKASKACYKIMHQQMQRVVASARSTGSKGWSIKKGLPSSKSEADKWDTKMDSILQLVVPTEQEAPVNLGEVVTKLDQIKAGDEEAREHFTRALGDYAIKNGDLKDSTDDPSGSKRYALAMLKLCKPFAYEKDFLAATGGINTDEEERQPFEFYNTIYSMVRITNHEPIFTISKDEFENNVLKYNWEALYLATFTCQLISTTWAELNYDTTVDTFAVAFQPGSDVMIADWPIEIMTERLPSLYQKNDKEVSQEPPSPARSSFVAVFGNKIKAPKVDPEEDQPRVPPSPEHQTRWQDSQVEPIETPQRSGQVAKQAEVSQPSQPSKSSKPWKSWKLWKKRATTPQPQPQLQPQPQPAPQPAPSQANYQAGTDLVAGALPKDTLKLFKDLHKRNLEVPIYYRPKSAADQDDQHQMKTGREWSLYGSMGVTTAKPSQGAGGSSGLASYNF